MLRRFTARVPLNKAALAFGRWCSTQRGDGSSSSEAESMMHGFHKTLSTNRRALMLHKQLTIALAGGDVDTARDSAEMLAALVAAERGITVAPDASSASVDIGAALNPSPSADNPTGAEAEEGELPPLSPDQLEQITDKVVQGALASKRDTISKYPLEVTVLDYHLELANGDDDDAMAVLEEYMHREEQSFAAQRHAIANTVLKVAKRCGVDAFHLSEALVLADSGDETGGEKSQMARRYCNLVIRASAPAAAQGGAPTDSDPVWLTETLTSMREQSLRGITSPIEREVAWNPRVEQIARFELLRTENYMSYHVGLHESVTEALRGVELRQLHPQGKDSNSKTDDDDSIRGSEPFVRGILHELNNAGAILLQAAENGTDSSDVDPSAEAIGRPVVPVDYVIRLCLGFRNPEHGDTRPHV